MNIIHSTQDHSVNFVDPQIDGGFFEARYVRREDHYFIVYLSCQSGCDQACRMCHLTATGQNRYEDATVEQLIDQANSVYEHYALNPKANLVHYNFMARGEPLNSKAVLDHNASLFSQLHNMASAQGLDSKVLISTIMPSTLGSKSLKSIFTGDLPEIYYSVYSMREAFRRRWLARALPAEQGLDKLKSWQDATGKIPKIHFAFIEGENDSEEDIRLICEAVEYRDLRVGFNVVRYNPHSEKYGRESSIDVIERNVKMFEDWGKFDSIKVVPKVGFDVKASCGMFIEPGQFSPN